MQAGGGGPSQPEGGSGSLAWACGGGGFPTDYGSDSGSPRGHCRGWCRASAPIHTERTVPASARALLPRLATCPLPNQKQLQVETAQPKTGHWQSQWQRGPPRGCRGVTLPIPGRLPISHPAHWHGDHGLGRAPRSRTRTERAAGQPRRGTGNTVKLQGPCSACHAVLGAECPWPSPELT